MRVTFATAEYSPIATVGGLAAASAGLVGALRRSGIDVDVVCDGEMDGKYIFKSRGGEYTEHYTASGDLCY